MFKWNNLDRVVLCHKKKSHFQLIENEIFLK